MTQSFGSWLPAVITCGVLAVACLAIARMARTVEHRLIDIDLDDRERRERMARPTRTAQQTQDRADRLKSIADHHRAADYLLLGVLALVAINAVLYLGWSVPPILSIPLAVLVIGLAGIAAWVVRRTPEYDPGDHAGTDPSLPRTDQSLPRTDPSLPRTGVRR